MQLSVIRANPVFEAVSVAFVARLPPLPLRTHLLLGTYSLFAWFVLACVILPCVLASCPPGPKTPVCLWLPCCAACQGSCTVKGLPQLICIGIHHVCFVSAQTNQPCVTLKVTGGFPSLLCLAGTRKMIVSCQGTGLWGSHCSCDRAAAALGLPTLLYDPLLHP